MNGLNPSNRGGGRRPAAALLVVIAAAAIAAFVELEQREPDMRSDAQPLPSGVEYRLHLSTREPSGKLSPDWDARTLAALPSDADLIYAIERGLASADASEREMAFAMLPRLIAMDAAAAARLLEQCAQGPECGELRRQLAAAWTTVDVQGAIGWVRTLKGNEERAAAATDIVAQMAKSDFAQAVSISDALAIGRDDGTIERLVQRWATERLPEAISWVGTQPAGANRDQLIARIALVHAQTKPAGAAQLVADLMTAGPARDEALIAVLQEWAFRDPAGAEAWVTQIPPGALHAHATNVLARVAQQQAAYSSSN